MINLSIYIKIVKVERVQPVLTTRKVGDGIEATYGLEMVHVAFDNNLAIEVPPVTFETLDWKAGDTIKATLGRIEA
jgi:hypothetical protein